MLFFVNRFYLTFFFEGNKMIRVARIIPINNPNVNQIAVGIGIIVLNVIISLLNPLIV